ncbi:MAG: carboxypeptidase-like regulatory domain-containing protein [Pyrinomonadaceae bacterium]
MKLGLTLVLSLLLASVAAGQSGGTFAITQSVIAGGGGGPSTGGTFALTGTIGQGIAGSGASGGTFAVQSGFWTSGPLGTSAATVGVSGRVLDAAGGPLRNVIVSISDSTGSVIVTRTNAFGYFSFDEVQSGQTYIVSIAARTHQFVPQVLNVNDSLTGLEFKALP